MFITFVAGKHRLTVNMKLQAGIFFGGPSRERERSYLSGRTIFDNLDRAIFEPVLIFVDNQLNLILLDWPLLYKGSIRDFYPPLEELPPSPHGFRIYHDSLGQLSESEQEQIINKVGRKIQPEDLPELINFALLAIPGAFQAPRTTTGPDFPSGRSSDCVCPPDKRSLLTHLS